MKDYTNYSYQALVDKMTLLLKDKEGWGDGYDSSVGQTLIQLMADVTDNLHYMLERRTRESYLETAILRSSIIARACELGYRYRRSTANKGTLRITLASPAPTDIHIPRYTHFVRNNIPYVMTEAATILGGTTTVDVLVFQGSLLISEFVLDNSGTFTIPEYESIENNFVHIHSTDGEYLDVLTQSNVNKRALGFLGSTDKFYDIKFSSSGMCVIFGDNINGKRPATPVTITYLNVEDNYVPILELGLGFEANQSVILDLYEHVVTNITRISGGLSPESDSSIKMNAVAYHKSNGRAVTNDDYDLWVKSFLGTSFADVGTYGEDEIQSILFNLNNVYVNYLKDDGSELTVSEGQSLRDYINNIKTSQAHVVFRPSELLDARVICDARKAVNIPISDSEMYDVIYKFFVEHFSFKDGSIGRGFQSSDIVNELYKLRVVRNGIRYPLIDFVRVVMECILFLSATPSVGAATIALDKEAPINIGDNFVIAIDGDIISVVVQSGDDIFSILDKMRESISSTKNLVTGIILRNGIFDYDDTERPVPVSTSGSTMTLSDETDFTTVRTTAVGGGINVEYFFYGRTAGRKPSVPVFANTIVTFTAPIDTSVNIYTRSTLGHYGDESLLSTVLAGGTYTNTFVGNAVIQIEYVGGTIYDEALEIVYPDRSIFQYNISASVVGSVGDFTISSGFGDLIAYTDVFYLIRLPHKDELSVSQNTVGFSDDDVIFPGSVKIYDQNDVLFLTDDGDGKFIDTFGIVDDMITIDYSTGKLTINDSFAVQEYTVMYHHNEFHNIDVGINTTVSLILPKPNFSDVNESLSMIRLV